MTIRSRLIQLLGGTPPLAPGAVQHLAIPHRPEFSQGLAKSRNLRRGMWVTVDRAHVGILDALTHDGKARVQLVEADGTNKMRLVAMPDGSKVWAAAAVDCNVEAVAIAYYGDIPARRRPSRDLARAFGYPGA